MKTILSLFLLLALSGPLFAQQKEVISKKGEPFLPDSGDYALSIDATPALYFLGNAFNGNSDNEDPGINFPNPYLAIQGRYMIDSMTAYRGRFRIGRTAETTTTTTPDFDNEGETLTDRIIDRSTDILLGAGMEWRKGTTRIQGLYGAEALIGYSSASTRYTYGTPLDSVSFPRPLVERQGATFTIGIRGFVGAEVFIFPKLALGFEFGYGIAYSRTGDSSNEFEFPEDYIPDPEEEFEDLYGGSTSVFGIDTDNSGGSITLTFYFN